MKVTETTPPCTRKFTLEVNEEELHILHSLVGSTYPALFGAGVVNSPGMLDDMYDGMKAALGVTDTRYDLSISKWSNKQ